MASVEKRASSYLAKTGAAAAAPYAGGKTAVRTSGPTATVKTLNQGVLKGPTSR